MYVRLVLPRYNNYDGGTLNNKLDQSGNVEDTLYLGPEENYVFCLKCFVNNWDFELLY